ncbi:hypothetical protein ACQJBY_016604 [Aegilops geniculata]
MGTRGTASFHTCRLKLLQNPQTNQPPSISAEQSNKNMWTFCPFTEPLPRAASLARNSQGLCGSLSAAAASRAARAVRHGHGRLHLHRLPQAALVGGVQEEGPGQGAGAGEGAQAPLQGRRDHAAAAMPRRPLLPHEHPLRGERDD